MSLYFVVAAALFLFIRSIKIKTPAERELIFDWDFTICFKGFCIFMVVFCHIFKSNAMELPASIPFYILGGVIDQTVIGAFFLFSGFGIMLGFIRRGKSYVPNIILRHILLLLLFTAVFLIPYYIRDIIQNGIDKPWYFYLEVLIGVEGLGNVSWFIRAILFCYLASAICGIFPFKKNVYIAAAVTCSCAAYCVAMIVTGCSSFVYDTILAFPAGMFVALYKDRIKAFLSDEKRTRKIFIFCAVTYFLMTFLYLVLAEEYFALIRIPKLALFIVMALCFTSYYTLRSKVWYFLGLHTWPIFILHMLPLIMLEGIEMSKSVYYLFAAVVVAGISAIGIIVEMLLKKLLFKTVERDNKTYATK